MINLDLELPFSGEPPLPPPRLSYEEYLEFIENNLEAARANGSIGQLLSNRDIPSEEPFVL